MGSRAPGGGWSRGVASPPLLLVATIVLFRVQGCEEGSKSAVCGVFNWKTFGKLYYGHERRVERLETANGAG